MLNNGLHLDKSSLAQVIRRVLVVMMSACIVVASMIGWPLVRASVEPTSTPFPSLTATAEPSRTGTASPTSTETPSPTPSPSSSAAPAISFGAFDRAIAILSFVEAGYSHLFAYTPQSLPLVRLTSGAWDDITPAVSPDGTQVAFASNRTGLWDLYLLDLQTGEARPLTQDARYDASPSFSPDGHWLAYESMDEDTGSLEIYIRPVEGDGDLIRLTQDPAPDFHPAWSPQGRRVAFVSQRSGNNDVWLADLDQPDERFRNISQSPESAEAHPTWSADGNRLAWSSAYHEGLQVIQVWEAGRVRPLGSGCWPQWSQPHPALLTALTTPNQTYLTGYLVDAPDLLLPPIRLPGQITGISWGPASAAGKLQKVFAEPSQVTPMPLWSPGLTPAPELPPGRQPLVPLHNVTAPNALLQDQVDEAFQALRDRAAQETGWDFLANLENAYVPLTAPLPPGRIEDWLYTGRAFAASPLPMNAGWMAVVREDYGPQTYWRVFLKTRFQDGSQGAPLYQVPWDFSARYNGEPRDYEDGGALADSIPSGYWVDFTRLAASYGWERLPALSTWRSAYSSARFNEFVFTGGLSWENAMHEVYPAEAIATTTPLATSTIAPSPTPRPSQPPTPARSP